jgi:hypothetical protein
LITACWIYCWYVIIIHNLADSSRRYRDILLGGDCKITLISFLTIAVCRVHPALGARSR